MINNNKIKNSTIFQIPSQVSQCTILNLINLLKEILKKGVVQTKRDINGEKNINLIPRTCEYLGNVFVIPKIKRRVCGKRW